MQTGGHAIVWQWEELAETDSTNRVALERVLQRWEGGQSASGLAVIARRQTAGRGQHGRRWESPEGGLYLSAVLENVPPELRPRLALAAGVCVVAALESLRARGLLIRWPNDIVIADADGTLKKLGGILCEAVAQGARWAAVIGIGINVAAVSLPAIPATSLAGRGWHTTPRAAAEAVLSQLVRLPAFRLPEIIEQLRHRDALHHRPIRLQEDNRIYAGTAAGIDDAGRLLLAFPDGTVHACERGSLHL